MQRAAVYQLPDRFLVHPDHTTTAGVGIAGDPYLSVPLNADDQTLGAAVVRALAASQERVPHPLSWKGLAAPRLKAAGMKSHTAFQRGARLVEVLRTSQHIVCEPTRNGGTKGPKKGFEQMPQLAVSVSPSSPVTVVAQAVRAALQQCSWAI